jgi:hypothetical protein
VRSGAHQAGSYWPLRFAPLASHFHLIRHPRFQNQMLPLRNASSPDCFLCQFRFASARNALYREATEAISATVEQHTELHIRKSVL